MILHLTSFIARDFVYKQNPDGSYILDNGYFVPENRNDVVDTILSMLHKIYTNIVRINRVNPGRIECNVPLLDQALTRYSRDIFGELRLNAKIDYYERIGRLLKEQRDNLAMYYDYGLKVDSCSPYIHRQLANLLYWLSVLKPFAVYPEDNTMVKPLGVAFEYHNEYVSYLLAVAMLKAFGLTLSIHREKDMFCDFLYDLHFRKLSRSSIEFFLDAYVYPIKITTQTQS